MFVIYLSDRFGPLKGVMDPAEETEANLHSEIKANAEGRVIKTTVAFAAYGVDKSGVFSLSLSLSSNTLWFLSSRLPICFGQPPNEDALKKETVKHFAVHICWKTRESKQRKLCESAFQKDQKEEEIEEEEEEEEEEEDVVWAQVAVVGGGVGGLACAVALRRAGIDCVARFSGADAVAPFQRWERVSLEFLQQEEEKDEDSCVKKTQLARLRDSYKR